MAGAGIVRKAGSVGDEGGASHGAVWGVAVWSVAVGGVAVWGVAVWGVGWAVWSVGGSSSGRWGAAADGEAEDAGFFAEGEEVVAGLAAVGAEVSDGGAVCCEDAEAVAWGEGAQRPVGAEDGQGAVEALGVQEGFGHEGSIGRRLFFAKKNQKTFVGAVAGFSAGAGCQLMKVFVSFFQKGLLAFRKSA